MSPMLQFLCIGLLAPAFVYGDSTFENCDGKPKVVRIKKVSLKPDPPRYPGNLSLTIVVDVLEDIPSSNLEMQVELEKLNPRRMAVPCLDNIGSCSYDVCEMIENHGSEYCPMLSDPDECGCPLKAGSYSVKNSMVVLPDFGEAVAKLFSGDYEGTITFTDKDSDALLGCFEIAFRIETSD